MGGAGKTALAVRAAHQAREAAWFPGGIIFVDLRGYSLDDALDAGAAAGILLGALGVRDADLPVVPEEKIRAWHALQADLADQRRALLIVFDNAATAGQVAPLLPSPPHRMLVTSRQSMSALPARRIDVSTLSPDDSVALLDMALRLTRTGDDRVTAHQGDAGDLAELCGHLPLALQICAAMLRDEPGRPLRSLIADLRDARTRLERLQYNDVDPLGRALAIGAAFDLSYAHLSADQARAFRLLALAPGPDFSTGTALLLLGHQQAAGRRLLAALLRANLIESRSAGRWGMHNLVWLYASEQGRAEAEGDRRDAALDQLLAALWGSALAAVSQLQARHGAPVPERFADVFSDQQHALAWLDAERECLLAAVSLAYREHRSKRAWQLTGSISPYLRWRRRFQDWGAIAQIAVLAARDLGDREAEGLMILEVGHVLMELRYFDEAAAALRQAAVIARELGNPGHEAAALNGLGSVLSETGQYNEAIGALEQALRIYEETPVRLDEAVVLSNLARRLGESGRASEAVTAVRRVIPLLHEAGHQDGEARAMDTLALALRDQGNTTDALTAAKQAAEIYRQIPDRHGEGTALLTLSSILNKAGQRAQAIAALQEAAEIFRETKDERREAVARKILALAGQEHAVDMER